MRHASPATRFANARQRGAAAILAMMFLVIFSALAAAMAIVSEGNLVIADSGLRVNRALAAAETGVTFMTYRMNRIAQEVTTRDGIITEDEAQDLWDQFKAKLLLEMAGEEHNQGEPKEVGTSITIGPIFTGPGSPAFTATLTPHPLPNDEDYGSDYYKRPPYNENFDPDLPKVSATKKLDARWIRLRVEATDASQAAPITRSIQMDFKIEKKIRYAILSRSRLMIGRNVMIEGPIGSRFLDTNLEHGHPVQMESDFLGLDPDTSSNGLDAQLKSLRDHLADHDMNGDNRIDISNAAETDDLTNPKQLDANSDGYIDDYDLFLLKFDSNADGKITAVEFDTANHVNRRQLLELIDTFGNPSREGYGDGVIDEKDQYAKIRGEVYIKANASDWNDGAGHGQYQDFFQGSIVPGYQKSAVTFNAVENDIAQFGPQDFDLSTFEEKVAANENQLAEQAAAAIANADPNDPSRPEVLPLGAVREAVPYGSAHPYDYYDRPVYRNMTFTNVMIPKGTNALFENCTFIGVTFVDTEVNNVDENFNYNGIMDANGNYLYRDKDVVVTREDGSTVEISGDVANATTDIRSTKDLGNNIRFDDCKFEGAVVSAAPTSYTQVRNKLNFTGNTRFADLTSPAESPNLSQSERELYRRSTVLAPHMSVEMGTFTDAAHADQTVNLSGTIVAGVIDLRGQITINGTLLTTFEPVNGQGPVVGDTSPSFNTTLGYFASAEGDLEAERPSVGLGKIRLRYDPTLPLPDGILAPISLTPLRKTYFEGGAK